LKMYSGLYHHFSARLWSYEVTWGGSTRLSWKW
jgi:hypothetical protein